MNDKIAAITATNEEIATALKDANTISLMMAIVHLTGDLSVIRGDIKPDFEAVLDPQMGITAEAQKEIADKALQALIDYRDRGGSLLPLPSDADVLEMVRFLTGREDLPEDYVPFLMQELSLHGEDAYYHAPVAPDAPEKKEGFHTLIIGAGMSGILAAIKLKEEGLPYTVIEKNETVGGTWYENDYPGCRVDSPNHNYSYSFAQKDWPQHFSDRKVLWDYFEECADKFGVRENIRFNTEVQHSRYDEARKVWEVTVKNADGSEEVLEANAVISAVGQLSRPKMPDIKGVGSFNGPAFHSAEWDHSADLKGKRVGVIGTGASVFQFVPHVAQDAKDIRIFQRTPPWLFPTPEYHDTIEPGKHWLLNNYPFYEKWFRFSMFWTTAEGLLDGVRVDPSWNDLSLATSDMNLFMREMFTEYIKETVGDDEELIAKIIPQYPLGGKRSLRDDGTWLRTLTEPHVHIETDPIVEIVPEGIRTKSGKVHEFDVLIYGTGFKADKFLWPMDFYGEEGLSLREHWDGDPRAYLGISMPKFPNLFIMYGPNTNIVVNGSIIFFSECEMRYILGCLKLLVEGDDKAMAPKESVHDAYNEKIDEGNSQMAWGVPGVDSWYKNDKGRVTQNWPGTLLEYWTLTKAPDPADYEFS